MLVGGGACCWCELYIAWRSCVRTLGEQQCLRRHQQPHAAAWPNEAAHRITHANCAKYTRVIEISVLLHRWRSSEQAGEQAGEQTTTCCCANDDNLVQPLSACVARTREAP